MLLLGILCTASVGAACTGQPASALVRHNGWVDVRDTHVLKHVRQHDAYAREKSITATLGVHPGFATLLGFDDQCQILNISRLHQTADYTTCMNYHKEQQVRRMFAALEKLRIEPSTEFYLGWPHNIFVDDNGMVTLYDFGNYSYNAQPRHIRAIRDTLIDSLYIIHWCWYD